MKAYESIGTNTILVTDGALKYLQFECLNKYSNIFEVDEGVYLAFKDKYENEEFYRYISGTKWKIDLKGIIKKNLTDQGLDEKNIHDSAICTKCNNDLFFSYRGDSGSTGSMAAFIQIRP